MAIALPGGSGSGASLSRLTLSLAGLLTGGRVCSSDPGSVAGQWKWGARQTESPLTSIRVTTTPDLKSEREIRALGPLQDAERLRAAYLSLLKLCLCDLAGAQTLTVSRMQAGLDPDQALFTRELREEELEVRAKGLDWPWSGLTMVGLSRLDDLQSCIEAVVSDGVEGDLIEAGVWRGGSSILMRATLDTLGDDRPVWLADSFKGFPVPDPEAFPADSGLDLSPHEFLSVPVEEVRSYFAR